MHPPRVLLLADDRMGEHGPPGHPERAERLAAAEAGVEDGAAAAGALLGREPVREADDAALHRIHPPWYVRQLEAAATTGGGWIDADTFLGPMSMRAARLAAGATIRAAEAVVRREAEIAFAVVRPPGHHAADERHAGFCLLNNVALAVAALREAGLAQRVAVLDWDVHHGDGTQAIFDADPDLCYASTHQSPLYPGSGASSDRGIGAAEGTKHNVPLPPGSGDREFVEAWREVLLPAVEAFAPSALLVSAGYDAHRDDPLAELAVTEAGYRSVAHGASALAARLASPGLAFTLEGGYDLAALRRSVAGTIEGALAGLLGEGSEPA